MNSRAAGSGVVKGMVKDLKTKYNKEKCGDIVIVKKVTNMTEKKIREVIDKFAEEAKRVVGFEFVWFTDGMGWISARNNLRETFDNMEHIYNIADMKNGIMKEMFK